MTTLLIFGVGMLSGIVFVGIVLNLTILKQTSGNNDAYDFGRDTRTITRTV